MISIENLLKRTKEYEGLESAWNRFALSHPEVRFCHLWQYSKVVEETYGYQPSGFVVKDDNQIVAILPASLTKSILFGKKLVSQPFSEYGGILSHKLSNTDHEILLQHLKEFCINQEITCLEMHGSLGVSDEIREKSFVLSNPYRYAILKLDSSPENLRSQVFDYQIRKALNKAERSGVRNFQDSSLNIIKKKFWPLFLQSMKRLGSPPHPLSYFVNLKRYFPQELKIFWAEVNGKPVSALLGFAIGERIQITNIVSDETYWDLRPNDFVHWEFIKWGCQNGYQEFDFGSVRYEGQLRYKKKWGAQIRDCGYYYLHSDQDRIRILNSSSKMMETFSKVWGSWMPTAITPIVGPLIRKQLVR